MSGKGKKKSRLRRLRVHRIFGDIDGVQCSIDGVKGTNYAQSPMDEKETALAHGLIELMKEVGVRVGDRLYDPNSKVTVEVMTLDSAPGQRAITKGDETGVLTIIPKRKKK